MPAALILISLLISVSATSALSAVPDTLWARTFGKESDESRDYGRCVVETSDGGFALLGGSSMEPDGWMGYWLIRTDSCGNEMWNRTYGGYDTEDGKCVQETSDGGYILLGTTCKFYYGDYEFWLVKTDSFGNKLWSEAYGGVGNAYGEWVVETSDGGFAMVGTTDTDKGCTDFWLIKTGPRGLEKWNRTYGGSSHDFARCVQETSDGGFILVGQTGSYGAGFYDIWLVKTDSEGNEEWNKTFGGSSWECGYSVCEASDGGYVLCGPTGSYGAGSKDCWLIKTDSEGNEEWNRTFGGTDYDSGNSVRTISDGGFILLGSTCSFGAGGGDFGLIKTDSEGNEVWSKSYGGYAGDFGKCVKETSDGGLILLGTTESYGSGAADFWLIRLRSDVGVDDPSGAPRPGGTALHQNYPNPFNPATAITYTLAAETTVKVSVHDTAGRLVAVLTDGTAPAGTHTIHWNGTNGAGRPASSGVYIYTLATGDSKEVESRKMILLK